MFDKNLTVEPSKVKPLQEYSEQEIQVMGQAKVEVEYDYQMSKQLLLVVAGSQRPLLFGHNWLQSIQLDWVALHQLQEIASMV